MRVTWLMLWLTKNTSILTMKIAEDAKKRAEVATVTQESAQQSQQSVQPGITVGSIPTSSQSSADAELHKASELWPENFHDGT